MRTYVLRKVSNFFKLLNVLILTLTGSVGLSFLLTGMRRMNMLHTPGEGSQPTEDIALSPPQSVNMSLIYLWVVLYGFVGTQLAWTLRPFFGDPNAPFAIFRQIEGNFYVNILHTIIGIFR